MSAERVGGIAPDKKEASGIQLVQVDPRSLMRGNIAYNVIDPLRTMVGGTFIPEYYERARSEVLRVLNPLTGKVAFRAKDGHHRIAAGAIYMDAHPDYIFLAHDVTDITLRENYKGQKESFLTEQQYYAEIGEATKAHGEIEFRRMAGHIFTDWPGWVGEEVANTFPALAALHTLGEEVYLVRFLDERIIHRAIDTSNMPIMDGEDKKTHDILKGGLKEMASRLITIGLGYDEIAHAGFELVTSAYEDIGEETREREIRGLLSLPNIATCVQTKAKKENLYKILQGTFHSITAPKEKEVDYRREEIRAIINTLSHTEFSYEDLCYILDISQKRNIRSRYSYRKAKAHEEREDKKQEETPQPNKEEPKVKRTVKPRRPIQLKDQDPNDMVIIAAESLEESLKRLSHDPSQLNEDAREAIYKALQQAKKLGFFLNTTHTREPNPPSNGIQNGQKPSVSKGYVWDNKSGGYVRGDLKDILPILRMIAGKVRQMRANGEHVPTYIANYPTEIFSRDWDKHASCKDNPDKMDVEGAQANEVIKICKTCPVKHACLAAELKNGLPPTDDLHNTADTIPSARRIEESQRGVRGNMTARQRRKLLYESPDAARSIIDEVNAATAFQTPIFARYQK